MKSQVTYGRDQREYAAQNNLTLFAVGFDGRPAKQGGSAVQTGCIPKHKAAFLFMFATCLADGLSIAKAFAKTSKRLTQLKSKLKKPPKEAT